MLPDGAAIAAALDDLQVGAFTNGFAAEEHAGLQRDQEQDRGPEEEAGPQHGFHEPEQAHRVLQVGLDLQRRGQPEPEAHGSQGQQQDRDTERPVGAADLLGPDTGLLVLAIVVVAVVVVVALMVARGRRSTTDAAG